MTPNKQPEWEQVAVEWLEKESVRVSVLTDLQTLIKEIISSRDTYWKERVDFEAIKWGYMKLLGFGLQNTTAENALMMDRLRGFYQEKLNIDMMEAFIEKGLTINGEKLYLIGKLSNVLHTAIKSDVVEIAYFIHEIVDTKEVTMEMRETVAKWQIEYK